MKSAIVLVGGEARRANGMEKYFFVHGGKTFIQILMESLGRVVDEIILVAKDPEQCHRFSHLNGVRCVNDIRRGIGPIGGIHAGVLAAGGEELFICACDMPCVESEVIEILFNELGSYDAVIPSWKPDMFEPLHAVYRREPLMHYLKDHESLSLRDMVKNLNCLYFDVDELRGIDPGLVTFTNINKIEDLAHMKHK